VAEGFGTLTAATDQPAGGRGAWRGRRWQVVITHPFDPTEAATPGLRPGLRTHIAFAAWDGRSAEVGARKAWASWVPFRIEE
jgi:DMSO reductase family type II enzyme heme b subunit